MDLKLIAWNKKGQRIVERELSRDKTIFIADGELKFSVSPKDEGFRFIFHSQGIKLENHHDGLDINKEVLLSEKSIAPIRKQESTFTSSLKKIVKNFVQSLPIPVEISDELQYLTEIQEAFKRLTQHYRKLNKISSALIQLESNDNQVYKDVLASLQKEDIFDEYSPRSSRSDLIRTLEEIYEVQKAKDLMFLNSPLKEISGEVLTNLEEKLEELTLENNSAFKAIPESFFKDHPKIKETSHCFDEVIKYLRSIIQEHRRISIIDPGDMIHYKNLTIEINHISPFPNNAQWETPFDASLTYYEVDQLLENIKTHPSSISAMKSYVKDNINLKQSKEQVTQDCISELEANLPEIRNILRYDSRIIEFDPNKKQSDILCNFGDFGNTAYYIAQGEVNVLLNQTQLLEHQGSPKSEVEKKSFWKALAQLWTNKHKFTEWRPKVSTTPSLKGHPFIYHQDIENVIEEKDLKKIAIPSGQLVGEISAMGRTPRNATVVVEKKATVLEIRWQGLRDLRNQCTILKQITDANFRERGMDGHLRASEIFSHLNEEERKDITHNVEFFSYGSFDWNASYKDLMLKGTNDTIANEPVVVKEGQFPDGIYMIRSGFARVSELHNHGHKTLSYIGKGAIFGLEECLHNIKHPDNKVCYQNSLRAIGYIDTIFIPQSFVKKYLSEREETQGIIDELLKNKLNAFGPDMDQSVLEEVVLRRTINGRSGMMIDMDRCTRCDDCVHACANGHDGNPRFLREGPIIDNLMIANACMHCHDPVCMIGCPTGAIHRNVHGGQVLISDMACIGCSTCANSCPYGNIRMVPISDTEGYPKVGETGEITQKATKCNLCVDQLGGPACERACPHDALVRMDFEDIPNFESWVKEHHAP